MNPLALSLLGLTPIPGAIVRAAKYPPVPHELFGLNILASRAEQRKRLRAMRMDGEVTYLRENGPMTVADLAEAFGIIPEAMVKDLRKLSETGRIGRVENTKPTQWEAVP